MQHQAILNEFRNVEESSDKIEELIIILESLGLEGIVAQLGRIENEVYETLENTEIIIDDTNVIVENTEIIISDLQDAMIKILVIEQLLEKILNQTTSVEERDNVMHLIEEIKHTLAILHQTISPFDLDSTKSKCLIGQIYHSIMKIQIEFRFDIIDRLIINYTPT